MLIKSMKGIIGKNQENAIIFSIFFHFPQKISFIFLLFHLLPDLSCVSLFFFFFFLISTFISIPFGSFLHPSTSCSQYLAISHTHSLSLSYLGFTDQFRCYSQYFNSIGNSCDLQDMFSECQTPLQNHFTSQRS